MKRYSKAERLEIVKLSLDESQTVKELATRFEINSGTLYRWRSLYLKEDSPGYSANKKEALSETERRLKELERENKELKLERDILKKAVGIFSKSDKKFLNS